MLVWLGEVWDAVGRCWVRETGTGDEAFAEMALQWRDAGATVIGKI
jgi:S-methylmethionine-dependent homocysteine/selenocysteine methylase